jgi:OPA family glycerol-3-phosphate transporter-like MFS transporter
LSSPRLRTWQGVTLGSLFVGYAGYYVCRSNLSVVTPLLLDEYQSAGLTKGMIGDVASVGVLVDAAGKLLNGVATEYAGGKRMFVGGMLLSVACTVLFALAPLLTPTAAPFADRLGLVVPVLLPFFVAWAANRFVQSMGWGGLVKIAALWFPAGRMATVMGVLSMSYLLGDAAARLYLGGVVRAGFGWQGVFYFAAGSLLVIAVLNVVLLKRRPADLGLPEPPPPPDNVYGADAGRDRVSLRGLLGPLVANRRFWIICLLNVGLTLIRETFNLWTPTYLKEVARLDAGTAGMASLVFPLCGAAAGVLAGWLVDRAGGRYERVMVPALLLLTVTLAGVAVAPVGDLPDGWRAGVVLGLVSAVAVLLIAPYTFCAGALAVKIGGQRGGAVAAGLIDTAGYLGATFAGSGVGRLVDQAGWSAAFGVLAAAAAGTLAVAVWYVLDERRKRAGYG